MEDTTNKTASALRMKALTADILQLITEGENLTVTDSVTALIAAIIAMFEVHKIPMDKLGETVSEIVTLYKSHGYKMFDNTTTSEKAH